jgi:CBS domain-containing protein
MTTDVLSFRTEQPVVEAAEALLEASIDGGPVVDASGRVVGLFSTGDVAELERPVRLPTVVSILGALAVLPGEERRFEEELHQVLGSTVGELMSSPAVTCGPDATVAEAAQLMHKRRVSRLPVVDGAGRLLGIVGQQDVVRVVVASYRGRGG